MTKLEELIAKLSELFELDKADLDFGIHRIIKSKHKQVREYLETRLPEKVEKHLGELAAGESASQLGDLQEEVVGSFGSDAINEAGEINEAYAKTPLGEKYQLIRESSSGTQASGKVENEVYSHLLEFFSRYYEDADFMSLRRRTAGRESYAIPYNGEEVVLHWANKDQYYIKSSEDLKDYTFTVPLDSKTDGKKGRVQFRLTKMDAVQNNNKASRVFQLDEEQEITSDKVGLVIPFHFAEGKKRAKTAEAEWEESTLHALPKKWQEKLGKEDSTYTGTGERNVLQKHLRNYTKKNTSDYFIHKDLGGFLRRELDFYVKNEVMYLDDIENRPAAYLDSELRKIKAIRAVAFDLIDFMTQFEEFQRKLWLKKKFVIETNWCVTLDRIPQELYPDIAANDVQREEWMELFSIDTIEKDIHSKGYSEPLTEGFLNANQHLVVDTKNFGSEFKSHLIGGFEDIDEVAEGIACESDNFHFLSMFKRSFREKIQSIYIDPPYNTGSDGFAYKDGYQDSSWLSMIRDRVSLLYQFLPSSGSLVVNIDDNESHRLRLLLESVFGQQNHVADIVWQKRYAPDIRKAISDAHEYLFFFAKDASDFKATRNKLPLTERQTSQFGNYDNDSRGPWKADNFTAQGFRPNQMYEITTPTGRVVTPPEGRCWVVTVEKYNQYIEDDRMYFGRDGDGRPAVKRFLKDMDGLVPWTWWNHEESGHSQDGMKETMSLFGRGSGFVTAKPEKLLERVITICSSENDWVMDFFAGSGTTGHAVISKHREGARRKFLLAEMAEHFYDVLIPRLKKAIYSKEWQDAKPVGRDGVSFAFKYLSLESYEDTLNNLTLEDQSPDLLGQSSELQNDYLLRYCLDTETSGSLLDCEQFKDPFNYQLKIYDRESGEAKPTKVDLPETFNYLLGLKVRTMQMKGETLVIEGENPAGETVLVIWRNVEAMDNAKLETFVSKTLRINTADTEYAAIYINGDTTLNDPHKKILLTEQVFHDLMFDVEDV